MISLVYNVSEHMLGINPSCIVSIDKKKHNALSEDKVGFVEGHLVIFA